MRPVGPEPRRRTSRPEEGVEEGREDLSLSRPWRAQAAGSMRVASMSVRLWIL